MGDTALPFRMLNFCLTCSRYVAKFTWCITSSHMLSNIIHTPVFEMIHITAGNVLGVLGNGSTNAALVFIICSC